MSPENGELGKRVLPEKYKGPVGRIRFGIDYTLRVGSLIIRAACGDRSVLPQESKPVIPKNLRH